MTAESLSWLLIAFAPIDWLITWFVIEKARKVREASLIFTAGIFAAASFIVSLGAILGFAYLNDLPVPPEAYSTAIAAGFLLPAIAPPTWLVAFSLGRFA